MNKALKFALILGAVAAVLAAPAFAGEGTGATVPEPSTLALLVTGIGAIGLIRHMRKR